MTAPCEVVGAWGAIFSLQTDRKDGQVEAPGRASTKVQEHRYPHQMGMNAWTGRLVISAALLFLVGWGLVLVSGHGGDSSGGSEAVWTIGGLMVYASIPAIVIAAVCELVARWGYRPRWSEKRR